MRGIFLSRLVRQVSRGNRENPTMKVHNAIGVIDHGNPVKNI